MQLNVKVCPYCNREYTFHFIYDKMKNGEAIQKKKVLYDFDHFITKGDYPYLALSFFNLVPSCSICNSRFKAKIEFTRGNNVYPFEEGFEKISRFKLKFNSIQEIKKELKKYYPDLTNVELETKAKDAYGVGLFYGNLDGFSICIQKKELLTNEEESLWRKAENNIDVFRLEDVYNQHKDYIHELIQKSVIYNQDYIDSLFQQFEGTFFRNREDVLRLVSGNYITEEDLDKRPLAKLTKDISEELGLI